MAALCSKGGPETVLLEAITTEIDRLGWRLIVVRDGDRAGLEADVLLMLGHGRTFRQYAHLLRRTADRHARTILWQADPLLPPTLTESVRRKALTAAGIYDRLNWIGSLTGVISFGQSSLGRRLATQRAIYRFASKPLFLLATARTFPPESKRKWDRVNYRTIRVTAECEQWIRRAVREGWLDHLCVSTIQKQRYLAEHGIASTFAPLGVYPALGRDMNLERDIDVLFIGTVRRGERRERLLEWLQRDCRQRGVRLHVVTGGCRGEARTELLNRARLLLHLHQYPWDTPWIRLFMGTACGAALLSEPISDARPFQPGVHYAEAAADQLVEAAVDLLDDPPRIEQIVTTAQECIQREFTLGRSLRTILRLCPSMVAGP